MTGKGHERYSSVGLPERIDDSTTKQDGTFAFAKPTKRGGKSRVGQKLGA